MSALEVVSFFMHFNYRDDFEECLHANSDFLELVELATGEKAPFFPGELRPRPGSLRHQEDHQSSGCGSESIR